LLTGRRYGVKIIFECFCSRVRAKEEQWELRP
jgi:hypothetical protein